MQIQAATKHLEDFEFVKKQTQKQSKFRIDLFCLNKNSDEKSYNKVKQAIDQLSRDTRSVEILDAIMEKILTAEDAINFKDQQDNCLKLIKIKFQLVTELAQNCKLSVQDLLKHASPKVYSQITKIVMIDRSVIPLVDDFCTLAFFKDHILNKSWFHILQDEKFQYQQLQDSLLRYNQQDGSQIFSLVSLQSNLHFLFAKIASCNLTPQEKHKLLLTVKQKFKFKDDKALFEQFNSSFKIDGITHWFESKCLKILINKIGLNRKYLMEKLLIQADASMTLRFYDAQHFLNEELCQKQIRNMQQPQNRAKKVLEAFLFLKKFMKNDQELNESDFQVCLLQAFDEIFPKKLWFNVIKSNYDATKRQNALYSFFDIVVLLIEQQSLKGKSEDSYQFFFQAIIQQTLYALRLAQSSYQTVVMSIQILLILLNHPDFTQTLNIFPQVFSLITHAYLQYSQDPTIKHFLEIVFQHYIITHKEKTIQYWNQIQFIMLSDVSKGNQKIIEVVSTVQNEIYGSDKQIEKQIRSLLKQIGSSKEDIRILGVQYILEIIEQKEQNSISQVMCKPEILKVVLQGILKLKQKCNTDKSQQFGLFFARFVGAIGVFHSFDNDSILLKATNQETFKTEQIKDLEEVKDDGQRIVLIAQEQKIPLTNMKYSVSASDKTLELLAVPSFEKLPVECEDPVQFAKNLLQIIGSITHINQDKPSNFYYTLFMLQSFIERKESDKLLQAVQRFSGMSNKESESELLPNKDSQTLEWFAVFLIFKIEQPLWQQVFKCCIPLLKENFDVLQLLLPYLVYWCLISKQDNFESLLEFLSTQLNQNLASKNPRIIKITIKLLDFLTTTINQLKNKFIYFVTDNGIQYQEYYFNFELHEQYSDEKRNQFISKINDDHSIKYSFMAVQKLQRLQKKVDKKILKQAAELVYNLKCCVFNIEDDYRKTIQKSQQGSTQETPLEDQIEIIRLKRQLTPGFSVSGFLNHLTVKSENQDIQVMTESMASKNKVCDIDELRSHLMSFSQKLKFNLNWKNGDWKPLLEQFSDFDLEQIVKIGLQQPSLLRFDNNDKIQEFELILALLLAEYKIGIKNLLHSDNLHTDDPSFNRYQQSLIKIKAFLDFLYFQFIQNIEVMQGKTSFYYKLFLHVLYEIESTIYFFKDVVLSEKDKFGLFLRREVNKDERTLQKIYLKLNLSAQFERLLGWYEERTVQIKDQNESLFLIYKVRGILLSLYDREYEQAFYLMRLAKLQLKIYVKTETNSQLVLSLFQLCKKLKLKMIDYDLEYTKFLLITENAKVALKYLQSNLNTISQQVNQMKHQIGSAWMTKLVYQKAQLLEIQLQIKIDARSSQIFDKFDNFVEQLTKDGITWERPFFEFAEYLGILNSETLCVVDQIQVKVTDQEKCTRLIKRIQYYIYSVQHSHKYIWQSLPRALELWFNFEDDTYQGQINYFMEQNLLQLESYKIATVLQLLLSRYNHPNYDVRNTIVHILSKLAVKYPQHCAWWIYHFYFFQDQIATAPVQANGKKQVNRADFANEILTKTRSLNSSASDMIQKSQTLLSALIELCKVKPENPKQTVLNIPKNLSAIYKANELAMPIQENLQPQLPPANFNQNMSLRTLVQTSQSILELNPLTLKFAQVTANEKNKEEFPAFKKKPICIEGFIPEVNILKSQAKPKKIGILGTDKKVYNFLLKYDEFGDMRKEQRSIDFAVFCNRLLQTDPEASQLSLRLRTYSIVPLSKNTGLIEWIQNTSTLRQVVTKQLERTNNKGATFKKETKPVLAAWFADHFLTPDLWYEAHNNFVKSYAIWSMIGYVIGLGDRHGENILIHQHTGEVTHVDFDCIFEKGALLKFPEIVPFRLTQNIIDAFGILKEKGIFQRTSEVMLKVLRKNQKNVIAFLESFKHDPLVEPCWKMQVEIKDALQVIEQKLLGRISLGQDGMCGKTHSVQEQVEQVILNAINEESLSKMFDGWMPYL